MDWDFPERVEPSRIEGIHPYPAKFIAELPRSILNILPLPTGTAVLDPFCGSGTTLIECQRLGLPSVGIDLNPIACLITRVKTASNPFNLEEAAHEVVYRARHIKKPIIPHIPKLDHWFSDEVQNILAALSNSLIEAPPTYNDALRLALSRIIVRVSNQESDTRYAAIKKNVTAEQVFSEFLRAARQICDALSKRNYFLAPATVIEADSISLDSKRINRPIGMVITSPPYPNAYEYWLYHKYRMYWLGFDPIAVKSREIGARAHFFKRNHHTADNFVKQMTKIFDLIKAVLVKDGYACFVIGRSRIHGRIVDNASIIEEVAQVAGFQSVCVAERVIAAKRKSFNLSHANIKTESIIILQRKETACS